MAVYYIPSIHSIMSKRPGEIYPFPCNKTRVIREELENDGNMDWSMVTWLIARTRVALLDLFVSENY